MSDTRRVLIGLLLWIGVISAAHVWLNFDWSAVANSFLSEARRKLNVGYIPVT
jgi:hypothetical protein